jgi:parvulin-like peptidyl-prolyl isomerase
MPTKQSQHFIAIFIFFVVSSLVAACGGGQPAPPLTDLAPTSAPTDLPPTPTPEPPLAARVNGEGILLEDFNTELKVLQLALQKTGEALTAEDIYKKALDDLIANTLLAQEAEKSGQVFDEAAIQAKADELAAAMGGAEQLAAWKQANGYSDQAFLRALARGVKAAWQRDQIMAAVPAGFEQVHARQILVQDEAYANQILERLKSGQDFTTLASQIDPVKKGELGWFPRGFLFQPEVEEAAFSTEVGAFSNVIRSAIGYHILLVMEKDPNRELGPEGRSTLQKAAVVSWVDAKRSQSAVEILIP